MCKCAIKWVDEQGNATPDENESIGSVMLPDRVIQLSDGRGVKVEASSWFPICAAHAKQLTAPGMEQWIFKANS